MICRAVHYGEVGPDEPWSVTGIELVDGSFLVYERRGSCSRCEPLRIAASAV